MNRAFYILGIIFSVLMFLVSIYFTQAVGSARNADLLSMISYGYANTGIFEQIAIDTTFKGGLTTLFFFLFFIVMEVLGVLYIKTKNSRIFGTISLSFSAIMLVWDIAVLINPYSLYFDEVGAVWILYALAMLAFSILGLIRAGRHFKDEIQLNTK
jgi:hypothetical protein